MVIGKSHILLHALKSWLFPIWEAKSWSLKNHKNTKLVAPKLFLVFFVRDNVCLLWTINFDIFRWWHLKLMKHENCKNWKFLNFDLKFLLVPSSTHEFCNCVWFYISSFTNPTHVFHGCSMAHWLLGLRKQHEGAFHHCFKPD